MKIALASDHAGFTYKEEIKKFLVDKNYTVIDCGTYSSESCDYPIFGQEAAKKVSSGEADFGVLVCSSGEGIMMAAIKEHGIRAGIGYNDEVSRLMRQHNNANMIAFGQNFMKLEDILSRIQIFLTTDFEGGRHERRVKEIE